MKNLIRNISIIINMFLFVFLIIACIWVWKIKIFHRQAIDKGNEFDRINKIYENYIVNNINAYLFIGMEFPKVATVDVNSESVSTDFSTKKGGLVVFFSPKACQPCLITILKILDHIQKELKRPQELPIYAISNSPLAEIKRFARTFELKYPFISDIEDVIFKDPYIPATPIVYLINKENKIIGCHIPTSGRREFSILFFNQLRFFQIKNHLNVDIDVVSNSFGLTDVKYVEVIKNEYDDSNVKHLFY